VTVDCNKGGLLDHSKQEVTKRELLDVILEFVEKTTGLERTLSEEGSLVVKQKIDGKAIDIPLTDLHDVLTRADAEGKTFLQVNFMEGKKILLTDTLVGFKPKPVAGLKLEKLPRVVTTPDLLSVFEAIEEAVSADADYEEVEILKRVFDSILDGGELIGFDLTEERHWIRRLTPAAASA
jgi:hypothetical protein